MSSKTHQQIDERFSGRLKSLSQGESTVEFTALDEMRADDTGLVHGGFVFAAADYAAMLAVNEPTVVLAGAEIQFLKPCRVGDRLEFRARVVGDNPRKPVVQTVGYDSEGAEVFRGSFACVVPAKHVLSRGQ